jgi:hypothetical protein
VKKTRVVAWRAQTEMRVLFQCALTNKKNENNKNSSEKRRRMSVDGVE